jgi:hypothetical protein
VRRVVTFDRLYELAAMPFTLLHAFRHQVADIIATVPGRARDPVDGFALKVIQGEDHAQFGAVLATSLKAVWVSHVLLVCAVIRLSCRCDAVLRAIPIA